MTTVATSQTSKQYISPCSNAMPLKTTFRYGFKNVVVPSDIYMMNPPVWPFSSVLKDYHSQTAKSSKTSEATFARPDMKIDSIFVYADPRDFGLDLALIIDCLLSRQGHLGTLSEKNGNPQLPNHGYQQDGQPLLHFSNPDLWFASTYKLARLGQGAFRAALEGVWAEITGGPGAGVELQKKVFGKPFQDTYEFAEKKLRNRQRRIQSGETDVPTISNIFMVGDNTGTWHLSCTEPY